MRRILLTLACAAVLSAAPDGKLLLRQDWTIQSSADVREIGAALATPGFRPRGWYDTKAPSTVFSTLVAAKKFPDPYFAMNLRSAPGVRYNIGVNFSNLPMPEDSPFRKP